MPEFKEGEHVRYVVEGPILALVETPDGLGIVLGLGQGEGTVISGRQLDLVKRGPGTRDAEIDLAAIEAREQAARPGPWRRHDDSRDLVRWVQDEDGVLDISFGYVGNRSQDDAEFVAHARTDVPALVAEVKRLRADLAVALEVLIDVEDPVGVRDIERARSLLDDFHRAHGWDGKRGCDYCTAALTHIPAQDGGAQ